MTLVRNRTERNCIALSHYSFAYSFEICFETDLSLYVAVASLQLMVIAPALDSWVVGLQV